MEEPGTLAVNRRFRTVGGPGSISNKIARSTEVRPPECAKAAESANSAEPSVRERYRRPRVPKSRLQWRARQGEPGPCGHFRSRVGCELVSQRSAVPALQENVVRQAHHLRGKKLRDEKARTFWCGLETKQTRKGLRVPPRSSSRSRRLEALDLVQIEQKALTAESAEPSPEYAKKSEKTPVLKPQRIIIVY